MNEFTKYTDQDDRDNADAVYQVSVPANRTLYDHLRRREPEMCTALRELMKEDFEAVEQKATREGKKAGFMEAIIGIVKDGVITPEMGAERLHISVDEMKRLAALE